MIYDNSLDSVLSGAPYLKLQNFNYMKNNEYFDPIADGYTLYGYQFNPQLGYKINENVSLEGGIYLMKDFGNKDFVQIAPTLSLRYRKNDFSMIFGNIDGSLNHNLIEPIYNFERSISNRLENGTQFLLNKKYFDFDIWVDWQNMIYRLSSEKEKIWGGISANAFKYRKNDLELKIPVQFTAHHVGGQIDTARFGSYTNVNYSAGLKIRFKNIYTDLRYVNSINNSFDSTIIKKNTDGILASLGLNILKTDIMFSYWYGNNYGSDFGGFLYNSMSSTVHFAGTYQNYRNLILLRITKVIKLTPGVDLTLRAEPHYDIGYGIFEYSYGFYINLNKNLSLKKN